MSTSTQLFSTTGFASTNPQAQMYLNAFKGYLFMCGYQLNNKLYRISLDNPSSPPTILFTSSDTMDGLGNDGTYLYICNQTSGGIKRYDVNGIQDTSWTVNSNLGWGLTIYKNYIFTSNFSGGTISRISIANKTFINNFVTGLTRPGGIHILNDIMYVCRVDSNNLGEIYKIPINFSANPPTAGAVTTFKSGLNVPFDILSYNNTLYVSFQSDKQIIQYDLSGTALRTISSGTTSYCCGLTIATINRNIYLFNANLNIYRYLLDTPPPFFSGQITCSNIKYFH
jgi:hypothetical protein